MPTPNVTRRLCVLLSTGALLAACHTDEDPGTPDASVCVIAAADLGEALDPACPIRRPPADKLDEALALVGLDRCRLGYSAADWSIFSKKLTQDPYRLPWYDAVHDHAVRAPAFARDLVTRLDEASGSATRLSDALAIAAESFSAHPIGCLAPLPVATQQPLAAAVARVITEAGGVADQAALEADASDVPIELQRTLAEVVLAAAEANAHVASVLAPLSTTEREVLAQVSKLSLTALDGRPDLTDSDVQALLSTRVDLAALAEGAVRLAARLDAVPLRAHAGSSGFSFEQATPIGRIVLRDAAKHEWADDGAAVLVQLDTGGDDHYLGPTGAIDGLADPGGVHHVSVAIDLAGHDDYGYTETSDSEDTGRLPSDAAGRYHSTLPPTQDYGPVSLSETPRQGAARLGYGFLLDLGAEGDAYHSLRMSQGYGAGGVGLLYDAGGDDSYDGEAGVQGAATFGMGLLLDDGGNDVYRAYVQTQGFGYVRGVGLLYDASGSDQYLANTGDPAFGGDPIYLSAQIPGKANDSFAQGAGFGNNGGNDESYMSGGLGVLRDRRGDDTYRAAVYAQASGYWFGTGILADQEGTDHYDGRYYVQGAGAHFALAVFLDEAGDDSYNALFTPTATSIGIGHDFTVAWHIDSGGNDSYRGPGLSLGGGNANGIGVLVNLGGDDVYRSAGEPTLGVGNLSAEVDTWPERQPIATTGVFIDVGGHDVYQLTSNVVRGDDTTWVNNREPPDAGITSEHGAGIDSPGGTVSLP